MKYILENKSKILGAIMIIAIVLMIGKKFGATDGLDEAREKYTKYQEVNIETIKPILKPYVAPLPEAPAVCNKSEVEFILKGDDIWKNANLIVLDLGTFELFKTKRIDNKRNGYYYRRSGASKEWYSVFKTEPKLKSYISNK